MSANNDGGPAFGKVVSMNSDGPCFISDSCARIATVGGMSLRDWFAGQATEQDVQNHGGGWNEAERRTWTREEAKYRYADAMIAAKEARK